MCNNSWGVYSPEQIWPPISWWNFSVCSLDHGYLFKFGANYSICIFVYKNVDECEVLNSASWLISWLTVCVLHVKSVENAPTVRERAQVLWLCMLAQLGHIWWTYEHVFSDQHTMFFSIFFPACVRPHYKRLGFPSLFLTVRFPPSVSQS